MHQNREFGDPNAWGQTWSEILKPDAGRYRKRYYFVPKGAKPQNMKQLEHFCYFEFVKLMHKRYGFHRSLEVGCGRATMSLYIQKYLGEKVYACDIKTEAINLAMDNFRKFHGEGSFFVGNAVELPYRNNTFDLVFSVGLWEHFRDIRPVIRDMCRVARPGGFVFSVNLPDKNSWDRRIGSHYRKWAGVFQRNLNRFEMLFKHPKTGMDDMIGLARRWLRGADRNACHETNSQLPPYRSPTSPDEYSCIAEECGAEWVQCVPVSPFIFFTPAPAWFERLVTGIYWTYFETRRRLTREEFRYRSSYEGGLGHILLAQKRSENNR